MVNSLKIKKSHPSFRIFVVSHDRKLLDLVPERAYIEKVMLGDLDLPPKYRGENLAENRFLILNNLVSGDFDYVGFASARWDERFPDWPSLGNLSSIFEYLANGDSFKVYAPAGVRLSSTQLRSWVRAHDLEHPGMASLIEQIISHNEINLGKGRIFNVVMGNNFILPKELAREFLAFWQRNFNYLVSEFDLDFPFSYRCKDCGYENKEGFDRYSRERHAGFLMERVSALFFVSRSDLTLMRANQDGVFSVKKKPFYRSLGIGNQFRKIRQRILEPREVCRGGHRPH